MSLTSCFQLMEIVCTVEEERYENTVRKVNFEG